MRDQSAVASNPSVTGRRTVALVALIVADVTVYASLRSYLYQQVDSTLEASAFPVQDAVTVLPGDIRLDRHPATPRASRPFA